MNSEILKVATRNSKLAIFQAQYVCDKLKIHHPNIKTKLIPIITEGDILSKKKHTQKKIKTGIFIKELERALIKNQADIAVHSMKDITISIPKELIVPILCKRDDPRDAFISIKYKNIASMPPKSIIGTSSLRRKCQILSKRPDLIFKNLRGNIDTRIQKLQKNQYDAIILAVAGLNRLNLTKYIRVYIDPADILPAMGQGAIAIECRANDINIISILSPLYHKETSLRVQSEQALTSFLESYCQLPIASYAEIINDKIWLRALIGLPDGSKIVRAEGTAPIHYAKKLGQTLAKKLLTKFKKTTNLNINEILKM